MGCGASHATNYDELQEEFEKKHMAWSGAKLEDYNTRVKKNVQEDKIQLTIGQLKLSMKGVDSFNDLSNDHSVLRQQMDSRYIADEPEKKGDESKVSLRNLQLVGVLYCDASKEVRAKTFADVVVTGDDVAKSDTSLTAGYCQLLQFSTSFTLHYAIVHDGKHVSAED